ncbi:acyltransferase family protein [Blastococcus sp. SYSU D00922]
MLTLPAPPIAPRVPAAQERTFLPEVQALRALAVLLVVGYHFWPNRLHGGFVGVDVFFVISGFLITSHLHREVVTHGRIRLADFYARRARRLLPAAVLVLLVSAAGTLAFLPVQRWSATAGELLASALYGQNWLLAARAVDYSASQNAASPVQHYWSLSVEEQFYLVWPALILLLLALARRVTRISRDGLLLTGVLTVSGLSLAWSVHATYADQAAAYFTTPTRIWELGAGAALALGMRMRAQRTTVHRTPSVVGPVLLRWLGAGAIAVSAVALSSSSPFPGFLALLPVLGTVAVIAAGEPGPRDPAGIVVRQRHVQLVGDVSYALYLWHWPAIVLLPFALDRDPGAKDKVVLLLVCIGLAWLTKKLVEDPARRWRLLAPKAATALGTVAAMLLVCGAGALVWHRVAAAENEALARIAAVQTDPCFGAAALGALTSQRCQDPFRAPRSVAIPAGDEPWFPEPACRPASGALPASVCRFSSTEPTRTVALVGDSHAQHWRAAVEELAEQLDWEVVEIFRGACTATHARTLGFEDDVWSRQETEECRDWTDAVDAELARLEPDIIFTSGFVSAMTFHEDPDRSVSTGAEGFADAWTSWADQGADVVVLRDIPTTGGIWMNDCLALNPTDPLACSRPRSEAVVPDAISAGAQLVASDERIRFVDLTDHFCDDQRCYAVVGGAIVYYDRDHLTGQFARTLAPFLLERISGTLD